MSLLIEINFEMRVFEVRWAKEYLPIYSLSFQIKGRVKT